MVAVIDPQVGAQLFGGAKDEQGRGDVADLEQGDADHQPPEPTVQDRAHLDAERSAGSVGSRGALRMA